MLLYLSWPQASIIYGVTAGQCGGQQRHSELLGVLVSSTFVLDTAVICQRWSPGRGPRCCSHAAAGDELMLCTTLCVPGMYSPMDIRVQVCQALPPSCAQVYIPPMIQITAVSPGELRVSPAWLSPSPLPRTTQAGHILALLRHLDSSVVPKSGSLCLVHPHPLGAGKERV